MPQALPRAHEEHVYGASAMKKGFTLIELMIYTGIFAIVLSVALMLFFQAKTLENQIVQNQEIDQNARAVLLDFMQTIHSATDVSSPLAGQSANTLLLNSNSIEYAVTNGVVQKTTSGETSALTTPTVTVEDLTFTTRDGGDKPTVSLSFSIRTNTRVYGLPNYITRTYQTTMQLR